MTGFVRGEHAPNLHLTYGVIGPIRIASPHSGSWVAFTVSLQRKHLYFMFVV